MLVRLIRFADDAAMAFEDFAGLLGSMSSESYK
jgi:hypothetical protein